MIIPSGPLKVLVATKVTDFRKGANGLAALVQHELKVDPFSGVLFVFRSKRANRIKLLPWPFVKLRGTGMVLIAKTLQSGTFHWPQIHNGVMRISGAQAAALFEDLDWSRVHSARVARPQVTQCLIFRDDCA